MSCAILTTLKPEEDISFGKCIVTKWADQGALCFGHNQIQTLLYKSVSM